MVKKWILVNVVIFIDFYSAHQDNVRLIKDNNPIYPSHFPKFLFYLCYEKYLFLNFFNQNARKLNIVLSLMNLDFY